MSINLKKAEKPAKTEEVTEVAEETSSPSVFNAEEQITVESYARSVVILEKAIETHNNSGISVIEMFEQSRQRLIASGMPKKEVLSEVYRSAAIVANMPEIEIDGKPVAISDRANKRMIKELTSVLAYYESGLTIRHTALPFTTFAKIVTLHKESPKNMTAGKIKNCLSVYKGAKDLTPSQEKDLDKKYADKIKNLIIMVEAMNLTAEFNADDVPSEFKAILAMAEKMDASAINNMIAGLKVAKNASEGIYKAS